MYGMLHTGSRYVQTVECPWHVFPRVEIVSQTSTGVFPSWFEIIGGSLTRHASFHAAIRLILRECPSLHRTRDLSGKPEIQTWRLSGYLFLSGVRLFRLPEFQTCVYYTMLVFTYIHRKRERGRERGEARERARAGERERETRGREREAHTDATACVFYLRSHSPCGI